MKSRLPFYYGWMIVAVVFVTMAIGVNARTAFSLLFPPIVGEFGWRVYFKCVATCILPHRRPATFLGVVGDAARKSAN